MKARRARQDAETGGLALSDAAFHLVCTAPPSSLLAYFTGTIPFVLGFLFFWTDMSRSAFAAERCLVASLALAATPGRTGPSSQR